MLMLEGQHSCVQTRETAPLKKSSVIIRGPRLIILGLLPFFKRVAALSVNDFAGATVNSLWSSGEDFTLLKGPD